MGSRIGIVGCGLMGTEHAKRMERAGGDIVAGVDVAPEARERFADTFDADVYEDYADLYAGDVDGVVVTLPNAFHEEAAVAALDAGLDVLLEKPVAHDLASAERVVAAARDSEGFCMTGFTMRFYAEVVELMGRIESGEFGDVTHVEARYVRRDGVPESGWFIDPDLAGGGALVDVGVHVLDLALAALDFPAIEGVYGRTWTKREDIEVEDSATALVRCGDGATVSLDVSWAANADPGQSVAVRGSDGGALLDVGNGTLRVYDDADDATRVETADHDWLAPEDEAFVDAVEDGAPPAVSDVEEGLAVQRVVDAIYRSSETGTLVAPSQNAR
ncbi:gfo/Idh/MocA family oxidoreductase [halophilic archaeon]|nr:gfo/Idh/MocA family oxidoreductase [halophilic archaeon]